MAQSIKLGLLADIHGDAQGFFRALRIFEREQVQQILCAGDVVDRGPDADRVVALLQRLQVPCVAGNHEHSVLAMQARWRAAKRVERLRQLGRIVSDDTVAWMQALPATYRTTLAATRILLAHGSPWHDIDTLWPHKTAWFARLHAEFAASTDVIIVGHTHMPMCVRYASLHIVNPGSVYGVTMRDSHTCATLTLPARTLTVFDLHTAAPITYEQVALPT